MTPKMLQRRALDPECDKVFMDAACARDAKDEMSRLGTMDLLIALAARPELWPDGMRFVVDAEMRESLEEPSDTYFEGVMLTQEVEQVLQHALAARFLPVPTEALLLGMCSVPGSDATLWMRERTGLVDPWGNVRVHVSDRLAAQREEEGDVAAPVFAKGEHERLVALIYLLLRDELPFGLVVKHVQALEGQHEFDFTNKHAEGLAREIVGRLT